LTQNFVDLAAHETGHQAEEDELGRTPRVSGCDHPRELGAEHAEDLRQNRRPSARPRGTPPPRKGLQGPHRGENTRRQKPDLGEVPAQDVSDAHGLKGAAN